MCAVEWKTTDGRRGLHHRRARRCGPACPPPRDRWARRPRRSGGGRGWRRCCARGRQRSARVWRGARSDSLRFEATTSPSRTASRATTSRGTSPPEGRRGPPQRRVASRGPSCSTRIGRVSRSGQPMGRTGRRGGPHRALDLPRDRCRHQLFDQQSQTPSRKMAARSHQVHLAWRHHHPGMASSSCGTPDGRWTG